MDTGSANAEELFSLTFFRVMKGWGMIQSFRQVAEAGRPLAEQVIARDHAGLMNLILIEPQYEKLFVNKSKLLASGEAEKVVAAITQQTLHNSQASVDAASLIFMHSILDDASFQYCRVIAIIKPQDWEYWIEDKQCGLKEFREVGYQKLFSDALDRRLRKLESESLLEKADMLFRLCKPPADFSLTRSYKFDRKRLLELDEQRHAIIHGDAFGNQIPSTEDNLKYLLDTSTYFLSMVAKAYGVRINPVFLSHPSRSSVRSAQK